MESVPQMTDRPEVEGRTAPQGGVAQEGGSFCLARYRIIYPLVMADIAIENGHL